MWAQHCFSIPCRQGSGSLTLIHPFPVLQCSTGCRKMAGNKSFGKVQWVKLSITWCTRACVFGGGTWEYLATMSYLWWNSQSLNDIDWYFWNWLKLVLEGQNEKSGTKIYIQEVGGVLQCQVYCLLTLLSNCCQLHYSAEDTREERHYPWWRYR